MSKPRRPRPPRNTTKPFASEADATVSAPVLDEAGDAPAAETPVDLLAVEPKAERHELTAETAESAAPEAAVDLLAAGQKPKADEPATEETVAEETVTETLAPEPSVTEPAFEPAIAAFDNQSETTPAEPAKSFEAPAADTAPEAFVATSVAPVKARINSAQMGAESFGTTVMNYFISEGEAFAAHMRALAGARSMGEIVRIQIAEFQRAADATLSCWGMLTMSASRTVAVR